MANWQAIARQLAIRSGINPVYFLRQINQESGFNPHARSSAGALGIAQIMPATARSWGVNPMDPRAALAAAAQHDAYYLRQYHGDWRKVLGAYNAGPGAVASGAYLRYPQTINYIHTILNGGNPIERFARGSAAAGAGGGGSVGGGGAASFGMPQPIQISPMAPLQSALGSLQNMLATHAALQTPQQPLTAPMFPQAAVPSTNDLSGQLGAIHDKLLKL